MEDKPEEDYSMPLNTKTNTQLSSSYPLAASNIESIDYAMFDFVNDNLNIYCDTNQGSEKVPVLFSTPERAFQIKSDPDLRTENGRTLNFPLITLKRTAMTKNPENTYLLKFRFIHYFTRPG